MDTIFSQNSPVDSNRIIYTPSDFAKTNLLHLQETGELQAMRPHISKRVNLSSYLFFLVKNGSGTLTFDGVSYPLKRGDCVFIDCRRPYSHQTSEDLWTLKWVHFYGPNLNAIYEKYAQRGGQPVFHPKDPTPYIQLLEALYEIASSSLYVRDMHLFEKLTSLLTLLMEESWNPDKGSALTKGKRDVQAIKEYLDLHYASKISLESLAEHFFINKFYLTRIFREQYGMTILTYLMQLRITHAKQLLRFTDLPVEKVASECGMNDANYFSRTFKRIEGITPGEYRKRW